MFHVSLLEYNTTRKKRVSKGVPKLDDSNKDSEEYEVEAICNSAVYANKSESGHLPGFYYLVAWKDFFEEKNTWEPLLAIQHPKKLISSFHKDHPKKPIATFLPINSALPMAKPTVKPLAKAITKQKRGQPANSASKQVKNWAHTGFRDNQPLIRRGLDGSSFFSPVFFLLKPYLQKRRFSSSNNPTKLGGFLPITTHQNDYPYRSIFPSQFPLG